MRRLAFLLLVVAAAAAAPTASARESWASAANRICAHAFAKAHAFESRIGPIETVAEAHRAAHLNIEAMTVALGRLAGLPRPRAQRARIAELLGEIDVVLAEYRQIERGLRRKDYARVTTLARRSIAHVERATALSLALGARPCSRA
jgi:hypothetical protein